MKMRLRVEMRARTRRSEKGRGEETDRTNHQPTEPQVTPVAFAWGDVSDEGEKRSGRRRGGEEKQR